jgi:hypothetical protein
MVTTEYLETVVRQNISEQLLCRQHGDIRWIARAAGRGRPARLRRAALDFGHFSLKMFLIFGLTHCFIYIGEARKAPTEEK